MQRPPFWQGQTTKLDTKYVIATYNAMSCELIILYTVMLENNHNIALSEEY